MAGGRQAGAMRAPRIQRVAARQGQRRRKPLRGGRAEELLADRSGLALGVALGAAECRMEEALADPCCVGASTGDCEPELSEKRRRKTESTLALNARASWLAAKRGIFSGPK